MTDGWVFGWGAVESMATGLAVLLNAILLTLVVRQLRSDKTTRDLDHERRRKEGSFYCWENLQNAALESRRLLTRQYGRDEMTHDEARELVAKANGPAGDDREKYSEILYGLREYLNRLERLALAIEMGVFDLDVIDTLGNTSVRRAWERNRQYIDLVRKDVPEGRQYDGLERLHSALSKRYLDRQTPISGGAAKPMKTG